MDWQIAGVFYCGMPVLAKDLKKLSQELTHKTSTRFEFHKEYFWDKTTMIKISGSYFCNYSNDPEEIYTHVTPW